jgi:hypothetical protein
MNLVGLRIGQKRAFCKGVVPDIELTAWAASVGGYIFSHKFLLNDPGCYKGVKKTTKSFSN